MNKLIKNNLKVIDFFCGAGGFSEGFRQQGFKIVKGIDSWQPAIESHNLNHNLNDSTKNVLDFWSKDSDNVDEIEQLEDTEFLIGSPSCVSFSMSNKAGKADKTEGVKLIEAYLRVIAVKKHKKKSVLKGWYMENVPKSRDFIKTKYTFEQLNLTKWAIQNNYNKNDIALEIQGEILNAGDYGAPQERKRFIAGEWVETGKFLSPTITHGVHKTVKNIRTEIPRVNESKKSKKVFHDPNYSNIKLNINKITDHFYDTGVYKIEWEKAEFLKTNHPFMGKMSFPENEGRTSRTIMATRSASTREALLYKSEHNRKENGEYRLPTIREIASLMGFPYVYQFCGSEGTKWRQVGNSVCPHMSSALAKEFRKKLGLKVIEDNDLSFSELEKNFKKVENLNSFEKKEFSSPRRRLKDARFRRHTLKMGNMTIDLMNYHPEKKEEVAKKWYIIAFFGTGEGYKKKIFDYNELKDLESILKNELKDFENYKNTIKNNFSFDSSLFQSVFENDLQLENENNPILVLKKLSRTILENSCCNKKINTNHLLQKDNVPIAHLMSAYGLLNIVNN